MRSRVALFLVAFAVWLLLTWPPDWQHLLIGLGAGGLVAYMAGDLFIGRHHLLRHPSRYIVFLFEYLPIFFWEVFKANLDVAYRVISPRMPIHPGIVRVRTSMTSDIGLTFLANSITLTPGTMTVDVDRENGLLYIHWIEVRTTDPEKATEIIVRRFERILSRVFEEEGGR